MKTTIIVLSLIVCSATSSNVWADSSVPECNSTANPPILVNCYTNTDQGGDGNGNIIVHTGGIVFQNALYWDPAPHRDTMPGSTGVPADGSHQ